MQVNNKNHVFFCSKLTRYWAFQNFRPSERFNASQLWPQKKNIQRNYQRLVQLEMECRNAEHPKEIIPKRKESQNSLSSHHQPFDNIVPPQNSDSRILRDGYFS